jgi:diacylglycerol kinase family enzyme
VRGIVFVNASAGTTDTRHDELHDALGAEVVECPPDDLSDRVRAAARDGAAWVGVAGGDGTLRCAADALVDGDVPLLVVPAGTRNHFAKDLGVDDLDAAGRAAAAGVVRAVDVGDVNGHTFVNNSSIGLYPKVVVTREAHERRMPKSVANLVAIWEQIRHGHRFWVDVDGRRVRAWMVFVGNGSYGDTVGDLATRDTLDGGVLDVRVVRADAPFARLRIVGALLAGRLATSPLHLRSLTSDVTIELARAAVDVALDGEVVRLAPPLRYRVRRKALRVVVPGE